MKRLAFSLLCTVCSFVGASATAVAQDKVEWRYFSYFPVNDNAVKLTRQFAEDVGTATNGRLKITVFAAGELPYKAPDVLRAVATNQVQMGDMAVGFASGDVPELNVLSLPFLCTSFDAFKKAIVGVGPVVDQVIGDRFKVDVAMNWTMPAQNFWFNRPITKSSEIKSLKIRTWNPEQVNMVQLLGGSPVSISSAEVIPALERKIIDGAITSALSANDWRAYEIIDTGFMANFAMGHQVTMINKAELAKLPEDLRTTLLRKVAEWEPKYMEMAAKGDAEARSNLAANRVKLVDPTTEDYARVRETMLPMWNEWAGKHGETGKKLLGLARTACIASN